MGREQYLRFCRQPGIFSESALQLTFTVLRKPRPALALMIQNAMNGVAVKRPPDGGDGSLPEHFKMRVTSSEADTIVSCLVKASGWNSGVCPGQQVILKALLDDWRRLANAIDDKLVAFRGY